MADFYPLLFDNLNDTPEHKNFDLWCGATFVYRLICQRKIVTNSLINLEWIGNKRVVNTLEQTAKENRDIQYVYSLGKTVDAHFSFDRLILNIRPKAMNRSKLNPVQWKVELTPKGYTLDDRPVPMGEKVNIPIWIDADITKQMLYACYDYELVAITDSAVSEGEMHPNGGIVEEKPPFPLITFDDIETFSYKRIMMYGEFRTHQIGDVL